VRRIAWWSVVFAVPMEFQVNVILQGSWGQFAGAVLLYAVIGCATSRTFPWIAARFAGARRGFWIALCTHAAVGLVAIEWGIMGHAPGNIPDPTLDTIAQAGMFAWWGTIAAMPRLLEDPRSAPWRRQVAWLYGTYAVLSTAFAALWGLAPVILMMPPVYCAFFWFYARFGRALAAVPGDPREAGAVS